MVTDSDNRIRLAPVSEGVHRPLWSVMIPTFHCARFLHQTLDSVLSQDPGPDVMQTEVIDDCSTQDDPESVVRAAAGERVHFFRQPKNVGYTRNFETRLQRARGHLVHLLHGDDAVRHGFYRRTAQPFAENLQLGAAFCRHVIMDGDGNWVHRARWQEMGLAGRAFAQANFPQDPAATFAQSLLALARSSAVPTRCLRKADQIA